MPTIPSGDVELRLDGKRFQGWPSLDFGRHVDAFSSVEFDAPFEPNSAAFREAFRPFSYAPVELLIRGKRRFNGRLVHVEPDDEPNATTVKVTAYSLPGVLADCTEPAEESSKPQEFKKLNIADIARRLLEPFGLAFIMVGSPGPAFDRVKIDVEDKVFDFLTDLAQQRGLVLSDNENGDVVCWQSVEPGRSVVALRDGMQPVLKARAVFKPQEYYSEITGYSRKRKGKKASKYTARNERLSGVIDIVRPMAFRMSDVERGDAATATKAKIARMFANACGFEVDVATWLDPGDALWEANTTLKLLAPKAFVYRETELLVRSAWLHADQDSETAMLGLVLPGVFSGKQPEALPWDV